MTAAYSHICLFARHNDETDIKPCDGVQCLNGGTCRNLEHGKFKCECLKGIAGQYCEGEWISLSLSPMSIIFQHFLFKE